MAAWLWSCRVTSSVRMASRAAVVTRFVRELSCTWSLVVLTGSAARGLVLLVIRHRDRKVLPAVSADLPRPGTAHLGGKAVHGQVTRFSLQKLTVKVRSSVLIS